MWFIWRPKFGWEHLCPIKFADPFGLIVIMTRAAQPVTIADIEQANYDYYPDITAETKASSYGLVNGIILALDYGLGSTDDIDKRRNYYKKFKSDAVRL
jgi:hypothetical protein